MVTAYIKARYGGVLPYLKLLGSKIAYLLGAYAREREVDWQRVERLVYVCKGNINRSPYAAYYSGPLLKKKSVLSVLILKTDCRLVMRR